MRILRSICVYCGSSYGRSPAYREGAARFGKLLAQRGIGLVYGGGRRGLMGALADAVLTAGGEAIGVIPHFLWTHNLHHPGLTSLHIVETMHERKAKMAALADAFVALPGGIGTLDEMFEVWSWTQLGTHAKPVGLLDVQGFYRPLVDFLDRLKAERFLKPVHRDILQVSEHPEELLEHLTSWEPNLDPKWEPQG